MKAVDVCSMDIDNYDTQKISLHKNLLSWYKEKIKEM